jgi:hypothetical protein
MFLCRYYLSFIYYLCKNFEFDEEDYYSSENNNNPVNSEEDTSSDKKNFGDKKQMNSEDDTDKEVCIDNQSHFRTDYDCNQSS